MLTKYNASSPIFVSQFQKHKNIKSELLELISKESLETVNNETDNISKTDFYIDDVELNYYKFIKPLLVEHMSDVFRDTDVAGFAVGNMWVQQYNQNDIHGWHIHGSCHWTNVYYVELPSKDLLTEIRDFNTGKLIDYNAEEGCILTFPSFLYHRSPKNETNERKTIISFNINFL